MARIHFAGVLSLVLLTAAAQGQTPSSGGTTYLVGTCMPNMPTFSTISAALAATPAPSVVKVCSGTYNEQIEITKPVTLEGVTAGNAGQAIVAVPSGGLIPNTTSLIGELASQLWVNNVAGTVNVTDITFDGLNDGTDYGYVVGIYFENTAGTVNRVTTRNHQNRGSGIGVLVEGGASNPTVTVENSSVHDFDLTGIEAETTGAGASELNATIKANSVKNTAGIPTLGIEITDGSTSSVSGNWVALPGIGSGIAAVTGASGSIENNTIFGAYEGVFTEADGVEVSNNKMVGSAYSGLGVATSVGSVHGNTLIGGPVGVEGECVAGANVHSNTINDAATGVNDVLDGIPANNSYYNVGTIRSIGYCSN